MARVVWAMVERLHREKAIKLTSEDGPEFPCPRRALPLLGPVRADGRPACGRLGSRWVSLMVDSATPIVLFNESEGSSGTSGHSLSSPEELVKMPAGVLRVLHQVLRKRSSSGRL